MLDKEAKMICSEDEEVFAEYVVIPDDEAVAKIPSDSDLTIEYEYEDISDIDVLKASLQNEVQKNRRFLDKLKDVSKKYRKALKKIEYQELLITEMAHALDNEKENSKNLLLNEDFAHVVYGSLKIDECEENER